jgi:hypothetical protein
MVGNRSYSGFQEMAVEHLDRVARWRSSHAWRLTSAEQSGRLERMKSHLVWSVAICCVLAEAVFGALAVRDATSSGRPVVAVAAVLGLGFGAAALALLATKRLRLCGLCLVLSAVSPTTFAWVVNVAAVAVGAYLAVSARRNRTVASSLT